MKVEMVVVVGSRGSMYRGEMREYTYSYKSHKMWYDCYGCGFISNKKNECNVQVYMYTGKIVILHSHITSK